MKRIDITESHLNQVLNATRYKKKNAQQLIEFLLVVPFMVIILGILTEYAYALNINMTLSEGLKTVTSSIYSEIKPSMSANDIRTTVTQNFTTYLSNNNVPTNSENNIQVGYTINGQTAVFMASYTYIPAFTLPNVYFKFMPDKFNFLATAAVPAAFLGANNYDNINSAQLDGIWNASIFTDLASFNGNKYGIMKSDTTNGGRSKMLFLVPTDNETFGGVNLDSPYLLVGWDGPVKKNNTDFYVVDTKDGQLYTCTQTYNSNCSIDAVNSIFYNYLTSKKIYNIIFIHDTQTPQPNNLTEANLNIQWISPANSADLSVNNVNGILKRALALSDMNTLSVGNYDGINVSSYNASISGGTNYNAETFGSMIFVHTAADSISKITNGASAPNINDSDWK